MYIDGVVAFSLVIVTLTCVVVTVVTRYGLKKIKEDGVRATQG